MKKLLTILLILALQGFADANQNISNKELCYKYIFVENNQQQAHKNTSCISAANSGIGSAQYSVGLGFYSDGKTDEALKYFTLAANNKVVDAYLPIAHILSNNNETKAIYWYKKYINATIQLDENGGAGYAALILAKIYKKNNNIESAQHYLKVCKNTKILTECKL